MVRPLFLSLLASYLMVFSAAFAEDSDRGLSAKVEELVRKNFQKDGPGVAILVSRNGNPIFRRGFGFADVKRKIPISVDSLFDLASVSKQFTAMVVLTLYEKGALDLRSEVGDVIPDFDVPVRGRPVTILDLLHHTSGLRDYSVDFRGSDREFAKLTTETHLKWLNRTVPKRAPGKEFEYNNSNYVLLSLIVERLSGKRAATFMKEKIFWRCGMDKSRVYDGSNPLPSMAVSGYIVRRGKTSPSSYLTDVTGDGNVYTSIRELTRWDRALRSHKLIRRQTQDLAWRNGRLDNGRPIRDEYGIGYGFGWEINPREVKSHTGSWYGTSTYISLSLRNGITVAVLSNDENADVYSIGEAIRRFME